jgi:hypothetical protein
MIVFHLPSLIRQINVKRRKVKRQSKDEWNNAVALWRKRAEMKWPHNQRLKIFHIDKKIDLRIRKLATVLPGPDRGPRLAQSKTAYNIGTPELYTSWPWERYPL